MISGWSDGAIRAFGPQTYAVLFILMESGLLLFCIEPYIFIGASSFMRLEMLMRVELPRLLAPMIANVYCLVAQMAAFECGVQVESPNLSSSP